VHINLLFPLTAEHQARPGGQTPGQTKPNRKESNMIYITEEGTAKRDGLVAEWKVTTTNPGSIEPPQKLSVQVFGMASGHKAQMMQLDIEDMSEPGSTVAFTNMTEGAQLTEEQNFQGLLVWTSPKTWAYIAMDAISNS
jgi:hypothetical protein